MRVRFWSYLAVFLFAGRAFAAFDCFLKLEGIDGESTDAKHPNEIVIESFSTGVTMQAAAGGAGAGKAVFTDLTISKSLDKSSPLLFLKCAQGTHIPSAVLTVRKSGANPIEYYKITLTEVFITSVLQNGNTAADHPAETITLNFATIQWQYTPQLANGGLGTPIVTTWNLRANTP